MVLFLPIVVSLLWGKLGFSSEESSFWWVTPAQKIEWMQVSEHAVKEQSHRQHLYLNKTRFLLTAVAVFALYYVIINCLNKWGRKSEEERDHASWVKLRRLAGPGFVLWAISFTVIITDWAMSVEPD